MLLAVLGWFGMDDLRFSPIRNFRDVFWMRRK
jgi:hypothetical protein